MHLVYASLTNNSAWSSSSLSFFSFNSVYIESYFENRRSIYNCQHFILFYNLEFTLRQAYFNICKADSMLECLRCISAQDKKIFESSSEYLYSTYDALLNIMLLTSRLFS